MTARTPPEAIVDVRVAVPLEVVDGNSGRVLARELPEGYVAVKAEVDAEWLLVCNLLPAGSPERDAAHSTRLAGASPIPLVAAWVATLEAENQRLLGECAMQKAALDYIAKIKEADHDMLTTKWKEATARVATLEGALRLILGQVHDAFAPGGAPLTMTKSISTAVLEAARAALGAAPCEETPT